MLYCTAEAIAAYCIAKASMCALQRSDEIVYYSIRKGLAV